MNLRSLGKDTDGSSLGHVQRGRGDSASPFTKPPNIRLLSYAPPLYEYPAYAAFDTAVH